MRDPLPTRLSVVLAAAFLSACAAAPLPWAGAKVTTAESALSPPTARALYAALGGGPQVFDGYRMIVPRGPHCQWAGGTPVVIPPKPPIRVGRPSRVEWVLDWIGPPSRTVSADGITLPRAVSVLASFQPLEQPVTVASKCWLLVRPDFVLVPNGEWLRYDAERGRVILDWVPPTGMAGLSVYLQLLVAVPEANAIGHILSLGIELHVGS